MEVKNSADMRELLNAMRIETYKYKVSGDKIILNLNGQQLMYAMNAMHFNVKNNYGETPEWQELADLLPKNSV